MLNTLIRFVENTKAKASEGNYNFDQVKQAVTELEDWKKDTEEKLNYSFFQIFDRVIKDHVLTGEEAKGLLLQGSLVTKFYPDAVAKIKEARETAVDTEFTYGDITFPYKLAANRWCIVDLQYKDKVDELFNTTGIAEFYIWDNENEQFYLPRNNWFDQYTNDLGQVNKFNEAGLPNISQSLYAPGYINYNGDSNFINITLGGSNLQGGSASTKEQSYWDIDASRVNKVFGKSDTVQPPSSNKLLYFVVGNTYVNQEDIDIAQVESELNNKLNFDCSNATQDFWNNLTPDYENGIVCETSLGVEKTYTIPSNGEIVVNLSAFNSMSAYVKINEVQVIKTQGNQNPDFNSITCTFRVKKNDVIKYYSHFVYTDFNSQNIVFYPYIGV